MSQGDTEISLTNLENGSATSESSSDWLAWPVWVGGGGLLAWFVTLRSEPDVDLWLHLRIGKELRSGQWFGTLPDPLTVLADVPYRPGQWLPEIAGSVVEQAGGVAGLHLLRALGVLAVWVLAYLTARTWAAPVGSAGTALALTLATSAGWGERPQLLGLVLLALAVLLWSRTLRDGRPRWGLVPLAWLWACCHGSFALGAVVGAIVLAAMALQPHRRELPWRRLLALEAAVCLVPAVTPLGPALLLDPFRVGAVARATVNEWQLPSPGNPLLVLVVLLGLFSLVRAVRAHDLPSVLLTVAAVGVAASSVRTIAVGAVLLAPPLARSLRPSSAAPARRRELVPAIAGALVLLAFPGVVWASPVDGPLGRPVDSALDALPDGSRVAADAYASGWVLWRHPGVTPMRDLRVESYSAPVAEAYERFSRGEDGWQEYADAQRVDAILVRAEEDLAAAMSGEPGWRRAASDDRFGLWVRDEAMP